MSKGNESRHFDKRMGVQAKQKFRKFFAWPPSDYPYYRQRHYHLVRQTAGLSECVRVLGPLLLADALVAAGMSPAQQPL